MRLLLTGMLLPARELSRLQWPFCTAPPSPPALKEPTKSPVVACRASGTFLCGAGQVVPWWSQGVGSLRTGIEEHG